MSISLAGASGRLVTAPDLRLPRLLALVLLVAFSLACANTRAAESTVWESLRSLFASSGTNNSKYRIYDSRTVAHTVGVGASQFFWINNEELLFIPMQITPDASSINKERTTWSLARWNIKSGEIKRLREFGTGNPRLCLSEGYVSIHVQHRDQP